MPLKEIKAELLKLEREYWQAIKDKDVEKALSLTDDPCIVVGTKGVGRIGKDEFRKIMKSSPVQLKHFEINEDAEVRMLSIDVAILAYQVHEHLVLDGDPIVLDAADASVWVYRDGRWFCSLHTETLTGGDAYGRDRHPEEVGKAA